MLAPTTMFRDLVVEIRAVGGRVRVASPTTFMVAMAGIIWGRRSIFFVVGEGRRFVSTLRRRRIAAFS
jgi:hypothetical protein